MREAAARRAGTGPGRRRASTGTASSTTRGWRWRWRARRRARAPSCSTTARSTALLREGGKVTRRGRARRRDAASASCCSARLRRQCHRRLGRRTCATWTAMPARPEAARHRRAEPGRAPGGRSRVPARATHALLVPKTADGRVLFAVPWLGKTILGTTDTPRDDFVRRAGAVRGGGRVHPARVGALPGAAPTRADVRSVWVGLRPLVQARAATMARTRKALSREHTVLVGRSGLVTVTGGKWTTYRAMAEDVLDQLLRPPAAAAPAGRRDRAAAAGRRAARAAGRSRAPPGEHLYGSEAATLRALPGADRWLWRDGDGRPDRSDGALRGAPRNGAHASKMCWRGAAACCSSMRRKPPNSSNR